MSHQISGMIESLVTLGAGVLLHPLVSFYMSPQVSFRGKRHFTLRAGVGLLPCVDSQVITQVIGEELISCVCHLVTLQGTRLRESLVLNSCDLEKDFVHSEQE